MPFFVNIKDLTPANSLQLLYFIKILALLNGRSSRILQQDFPEFDKKFRDGISKQLDTGFGVLVKITDEMAQKYLELHRKTPNSEKGR